MTGAGGQARGLPAGARAWLGCVLAGGLVLGLGGRLVMRVIAILGGPEQAGAATAGGNIVGRVTVKGTLGMIIPGLVGGSIIGAVYLMIRLWLPRGFVMRGLAVGAIALVLFWGFLIGDGNNPDFRFTSAGVQLTMFAALFPIFGLTASWLAEGWGKGLPPQRPTPTGYAVLLGAITFGLLLVAAPTANLLAG